MPGPPPAPSQVIADVHRSSACWRTSTRVTTVIPGPPISPQRWRPNEPDWINHPSETRHILAVACDVWFSQCNSAPGTAPLTFQAVIKLWTQAMPVTVNLLEIDRRITLNPMGNYDLVVVEEAQDASVAAFRWSPSQPWCPFALFAGGRPGILFLLLEARREERSQGLASL